MKFNTLAEFKEWIQNYSKPYKDEKTFKEAVLLSKDYIVWNEGTFIIDSEIVYIFQRVPALASSSYYICYTNGEVPHTMWWTILSKLYSGTFHIGTASATIEWGGMKGAKIWIIGDASAFDSFINWKGNPLEVKS